MMVRVSAAIEIWWFTAKALGASMGAIALFRRKDLGYEKSDDMLTCAGLAPSQAYFRGFEGLDWPSLWLPQLRIL